MAIETLTESNKYSNNKLQVGVIEKFVRDDPILEKLQFRTILGNGLTYNVESTEASANFYDVGDTWVEGTHTVDSTTATLKIVGGDADVDNFLLTTQSDLQDLQSIALDAKIKAVKKVFMQRFWYGYSTSWTKEFDGLHYMIRSYTSPYQNTIANAVSTTAVLLNMSTLENVVDYIKGGFKPDLIVMTKAMRRKINTYLHGVGGITYTDAANGRIQTLYGINVAVSDFLSDIENCDLDYNSTNYGFDYTAGTALGTSRTATTIFVLTFDPKGCCGLHAKPLEVEKLGTLETKDATRHRIKWYVSLMMQSILSCSKVTGVLVGGTVAA